MGAGGHGSPEGQNATDRRFFWLALYAQPGLWVGLAIFAIVRFEFMWLGLVGAFLSLFFPFAFLFFPFAFLFFPFAFLFFFDVLGFGMMGG